MCSHCSWHEIIPLASVTAGGVGANGLLMFSREEVSGR